MNTTTNKRDTRGAWCIHTSSSPSSYDPPIDSRILDRIIGHLREVLFIERKRKESDRRTGWSCASRGLTERESLLPPGNGCIGIVDGGPWRKPPRANNPIPRSRKDSFLLFARSLALRLSFLSPKRTAGFFINGHTIACNRIAHRLITRVITEPRAIVFRFVYRRGVSRGRRRR